MPNTPTNWTPQAINGTNWNGQTIPATYFQPKFDGVPLGNLLLQDGTAFLVQNSTNLNLEGTYA